MRPRDPDRLDDGRDLNDDSPFGALTPIIWVIVILVVDVVAFAFAVGLYRFLHR